MSLFGTIKSAFSGDVSSGPSSFLKLLPGNQSSAPRIGAAEILKGYSSMPWLRAVSSKVGEAVGVTDWKVVRPINAPLPPGKSRTRIRQGSYEFRRKDVQKALNQGEVEEVFNHPVMDLLSAGNEAMPGQQVIKLTQIYLDLVGDAYWLKERNGLGQPVAIYPIAPNWIKSFPTAEDPFYRMQVGNTVRPVPVTEVLRFTEPDPANPFGRGSGIGLSLADELQTDEYAAVLSKMRFLNSGRPDIIVSADGLSSSETKVLEEGWQQRHGGFWNAFKPFFVARKLDIKEINQTFADLQLVELRKFERDMIIQVFSVPPEVMGIIESSNRANIVMADFIFSAWVVRPRLESMRRTLQNGLMPDFGDNLLLEYDNPVDEDKDFQLQVMAQRPQAFTDNEFRELAGQPRDSANGDVRWVPINLIPVGAENPLNSMLGGGEVGDIAGTALPPKEPEKMTIPSVRLLK